MSLEELETKLDEELKYLKRTDKWQTAELILSYQKLGADIRPFLKKEHTLEELKLIVIKVNRIISENKKRKTPNIIKQRTKQILESLCKKCGKVHTEYAI